MRFSLMRRSYFHNGNDNKKPGVWTGGLRVGGERRVLWASHPPSQARYVCVCGGGALSLWPPPSSLPSRHIPKEPSSPAFSLLALAPTVPASGNLPPHLVNHLCQKFHSAAILGSQEQHSMDVHSCDEFRFTFSYIPLPATHKALLGG